MFDLAPDCACIVGLLNELLEFGIEGAGFAGFGAAIEEEKDDCGEGE